MAEVCGIICILSLSISNRFKLNPIIKMSKRKLATPSIQQKPRKRCKLIIKTQAGRYDYGPSISGKLIPSALRAEPFLANGAVVAPYDVELHRRNQARGLLRRHRMQIVEVAAEFYFVSERIRDGPHNSRYGTGSFSEVVGVQTQIKGPFHVLRSARKVLEQKFRADTGKHWKNREKATVTDNNGLAKYWVTRLHAKRMNVTDESDGDFEDNSEDYDSDQSYVDSDDINDFRMKNDFSCVFWDNRTRTIGSHSMLNTLASVKSLEDFSDSMLSLIIQFASEQCYGFGCNLEMHDFLIHGQSLRTTISSLPLMKEFPETLVSLLIKFVSEQCDD